MSGERVLLLGGTFDLLRKSAGCGIDVVHVQKATRFDPRGLPYCQQVHVLDFQDVPLVTALAEVLHRARPFGRVMTQTESAVLVAAHLTEHLRLPGNGLATARTLHDKQMLRRLLNDKGIGPVRSGRGSTREDLRDFVRRHGSAVIKPAMGSGSLGVRKVASPAEVDQAWRWVTELGLSEFMLEELLVGSELSVETYSERGVHSVLAITAKDVACGVVEVGHVVPAPLDAATSDAVATFVTQVLDAAGLVEGLAHTEVMLTSAGPRVVESHCRRGGGRINELVRLVYGIDMDRLAFRRGLPDGRSAASPDGAAASRFLTPEPGRVVSVDGVAEAMAIPGVREVQVTVAAGDVVRPLQWSEDRCGHVVVHARDVRTAQRVARRAAETVKIRTVPDAAAAAGPLRQRLREADEVLDPFSGDEQSRQPGFR